MREDIVYGSHVGCCKGEGVDESSMTPHTLPHRREPDTTTASHSRIAHSTG